MLYSYVNHSRILSGFLVVLSLWPRFKHNCSFSALSHADKTESKKYETKKSVLAQIQVSMLKKISKASLV